MAKEPSIIQSLGPTRLKHESLEPYAEGPDATFFRTQATRAIIDMVFQPYKPLTIGHLEPWARVLGAMTWCLR